jgi:hypothetical protein
MSRRGGVTIASSMPGFASVRTLIDRLMVRTGAVITSSNSHVLARVRDAIGRTEAIRASYEAGDIEITPLGELVRLFADVAEVSLPPVANMAQQSALAGLAASTLPSESAFFQCKDLPGFHKALASTFQELRRSDVDLTTFPESSGKISEISSLEQGFNASLSKLSLATLSHRLTSVLAAKPSKPSTLKQVLWVGEGEWPPLWIRFVDWLAETGVDVVLLVERHVSLPDFFPGEALLSKAFPTAERLPLEQPDNLPISCQLFSETPLSGESMMLIEASDEFLETEWAMRIVQKQLKELGASNICVFASNLDDYGPLLESAALRFGVSLEMDRQEALLSNPFAQHCLRALKACATGSLPLLADVIAGTYGDVASEQKADVAQEIRVCVKSADPWAELGRLSRDDGSLIPSWVSALVKWRAHSQSSDFTLADWVIGLNKLIAATPWLDASSSGSDTSNRDTHAQDAMVRGLATSRLTTEPTKPYSLQAFVEHCEATWRDTLYWRRSSGDVRVVSSPWAIGEVGFVIALGVVEGRFPGRRAEDPILLDRDRVELAKTNPVWQLPSSYERAEEGRRDFYRLACSAPSIAMSYPLTMNEHPQIRAAPLDDLATLPAVEFVSYPSTLRFPHPDHGLSGPELFGAIAWHNHDIDDFSAEIRAPYLQLQETVRNHRSDSIDDELLKARIAELPNPLRLSHLRALNRCRFQYVAMAKLGLRGRRPKWAWDQLSRVVRRADLSAQDLSTLRSNLMTALSQELEEMRGSVPDEELELVAVAAPRVLSRFAHREMAAREIWKVRPVGQAVPLHKAGISQTIPVGNAQVTFDETIDLVYERDSGDTFPVRLAYVPRYESDKDFAFEAGLMLLLQTQPRLERAAGVDSLQSNVRRILAKGKGEATSSLRSKSERGLIVDRSGGNANDVRSKAHTDLKLLLSLAAEGRLDAIPGEHCRRCDYAPFCRRSLHSETPGSWRDWAP